ncbi:hypothetical protein EJ02DRAFT_453878 [Clathrospora elynae]|uniref:Uncharacterized protein n=1 Tax=Clathrospora elynae TaxID=706981 RepID=A0A6A5SWM7_9PLEO|nr:hypothetical protein EJ02DRAFT_453878 [Clathrospora elynae]
MSTPLLSLSSLFKPSLFPQVNCFKPFKLVKVLFLLLLGQVITCPLYLARSPKCCSTI